MDLPEDSEILAENAYIKAKATAEKFNMLALGDDSGLYIKALSYFPGVHSRRWTGKEDDDKLRCLKIVGYMMDEDDKRAELISSFSLVNPNGEEIFKTKVINNFNIADNIYGKCGFGYDSILIPDENLIWESFNKRRISLNRALEIIKNKSTIAQLSQEEKNAINYRGRIAQEMIAVFLNKS